MSNISILLTRNLHDVFGENDPVRRRAAIDEIFADDCVFYDPKGVSTVVATRSIALQARSGLHTRTFDTSQSPSPIKWAMAGGSNGYRAALVRSQLTPGPTSSLPGTLGLPPFISFLTSYPKRTSVEPGGLGRPHRFLKTIGGEGMRFGTIGAGAVALAFGREALAKGHEVILSSRRGPDALAGKVAELGRGASAASVAEAASLGYVLLAVPWRDVETALKGLPACLERPGAHRCPRIPSSRRVRSSSSPISAASRRVAACSRPGDHGRKTRPTASAVVVGEVIERQSRPGRGLDHCVHQRPSCWRMVAGVGFAEYYTAQESHWIDLK